MTPESTPEPALEQTPEPTPEQTPIVAAPTWQEVHERFQLGLLHRGSRYVWAHPNASSELIDQLLGSPFGNHLLAIDHDQAIAQCLGLVHEVGHQNDGGALLANPPDEVPGDTP